MLGFGEEQPAFGGDANGCTGDGDERGECRQGATADDQAERHKRDRRGEQQQQHRPPQLVAMPAADGVTHFTHHVVRLRMRRIERAHLAEVAEAGRRLDRMARLLAIEGFRVVRYADDLLVLVQDQVAAERGLDGDKV